MTESEKEYMERQFAKTAGACREAAARNGCVVEFDVLPKKKFWDTWAKVNGYSRLVKRSHRFVAVLRLSFGGGDLCYSVSNPGQPEIAALDVLRVAIAGWTPDSTGETLDRFAAEGKKARAHVKQVKRVMDDFVAEMEK